MKALVTLCKEWEKNIGKESKITSDSSDSSNSSGNSSIRAGDVQQNFKYWHDTLTQFIQQYNTNVTANLTEEASNAEIQMVIKRAASEVQSFLQTIASNPLMYDSSALTLLNQWLSICKILCRTRIHLEALYSPPFITSISKVFSLVTLPNDIHLEVIRVLLNLVIINNNGVVHVIKESTIDPAVFQVFLKARLEHPVQLQDVYLLARTLLFLTQDSAISSLLAKAGILEQFCLFLSKCSDINLLNSEDNIYLQLTDEIIKLLCHWSMESQSSLQKYLDTDTYKNLCRVLLDILNYGTTLPQETALLLNSTEQSFPRDTKSSEYEQTRQALKLLEDEKKIRLDHPANHVSLLKVKLDISNLILYMANDLGDQLTPISVHSLLLLLHVNLLEAAEAKREQENLLVPILSTLYELGNERSEIRRQLKTSIFMYHTFPSQNSASNSSTTENRNMLPAGAISDKQLDSDALSVKALLLPYLTTLRFNLKNITGEFLFKLCDEQSNEFVRQCGFGNAVGLLSEKGLPGFANLKQNTVDLSQLMNNRK